MIGEVLSLTPVPAVLPGGIIGEIDPKEYQKQDTWIVLFFYPADFTWVCPTELLDLHDHYEQFCDMNTDVWCISTDSVYVHQKWREQTLGEDFSLPLVSDSNWELSDIFTCLDRKTGMSYRCTVILDPSSTIRYYSIQDNAVGRNADELVRTLAAYQACDASGGCVACAGWEVGDPLTTPGA